MEKRHKFKGVISVPSSFAGNTGLVLGWTLVKPGSGPMPALLVSLNDYHVRVGRKKIVGNINHVDMTGQNCY